MRLDTFEIFTKKTDQYYTNLTTKIDSAVRGLSQNKMTGQEIQALQFQIFNDLYKYPKLVIGEENKSDSTEQMHANSAMQLFPQNFRYTIGEPVTVTEITYKIEIKGDKDSVLMTVKNNPRSIRGMFVNNSLVLQYHFQGDDFKSNGPRIKQDKETFLKLLEENNSEVVSFFESKKQSFLELIKLRIEQKLEDNQRKIDNSNTY